VEVFADFHRFLSLAHEVLCGPSLGHDALRQLVGEHVRDSTTHRAHSPISKVLEFAVSVSKVELAVEPLLPVAGILAVHLRFAPGYSSHPPEHCRWAPELRQRPPQPDDHI
jgi:hypothetical protein